MDCNLYFGNISGVENRASFQNSVRYSEVVAKRADGRPYQKLTQKVAAPAAWLPPAVSLLTALLVPPMAQVVFFL